MSGRETVATAPPDPDADFVLQRLQASYVEVLTATKHEDDKVGRFLAAIAFLVAGALLFVEPAVLSARYDLGDGTELALPALALVAFLVAIVLAVLMYVLSTAAPVNVPPSTAPGADDDSSHLFFLQIAKETAPSWRGLWLDDDNVPHRVEDLRSAMIGDYVDETYNLALRADSKRNRSVEASALFSGALLFFGLAVGWTIDVYRSTEPWAEPAFGPLEQSLSWTMPVRFATGVSLALFAVTVLYLRLRREQVMTRAHARSTATLAMCGLTGFIATMSVPIPDTPTGRWVLAGTAVLAVLVTAVASVLSARADERSVALIVRLLCALAAAGAAAWAISTGASSLLLLLAVLAALSPLDPTPAARARSARTTS